MNTGQWRTAGASIRGSSHEKTDLPCQDAHLWTVLPQGVVIAAVADGAGSAFCADVGAQTAVAAAVDAVCQRVVAAGAPLSSSQIAEEDLRLLLTETLATARAAVEAQATARARPARDLASTLLLMVASADWIAAIQIGDGAVVAADAEGRIFAVTQPTRGEYLNETIFLTSENALATAQPAIWRGRVAHLAVFSDGLQMVALRMPGGEPHAGFFLPLFRFLETHDEEAEAHAALASFLESPRLRERTDDDVTLFLATWIP